MWRSERQQRKGGVYTWEKRRRTEEAIPSSQSSHSGSLMKTDSGSGCQHEQLFSTLNSLTIRDTPAMLDWSGAFSDLVNFLISLKFDTRSGFSLGLSGGNDLVVSVRAAEIVIYLLQKTQVPTSASSLRAISSFLCVLSFYRTLRGRRVIVRLRFHASVYSFHLV